MKRTTILLVLLLCTAITPLFSQEWILDINKAKKIAEDESKSIVLVFQGSDWCAPCIKLNREVWSTDAFKSYAQNHYVMLQADFPRKKQNALPELQAKANAKLAEQYNPKGIFPFVVIMDAQGKVKGETSYKKMGPEEYIRHLESFTD